MLSSLCILLLFFLFLRKKKSNLIFKPFLLHHDAPLSLLMFLFSHHIVSAELALAVQVPPAPKYQFPHDAKCNSFAKCAQTQKL